MFCICLSIIVLQSKFENTSLGCLVIDGIPQFAKQLFGQWKHRFHAKREVMQWNCSKKWPFCQVVELVPVEPGHPNLLAGHTCHQFFMARTRSNISQCILKFAWNSPWCFSTPKYVDMPCPCSTLDDRRMCLAVLAVIHLKIMSNQQLLVALLHTMTRWNPLMQSSTPLSSRLETVAINTMTRLLQWEGRACPLSHSLDLGAENVQVIF